MIIIMMAFPERLQEIRGILQNCKKALELFLGSFLLAGQVTCLCELFNLGQMPLG